MPRLRRAAFFGLLIGIFGVLVSFFPFVNEIEENSGLALLFTLRGPRTPPSDVVVVSIDKDSSESLKVSSNPARWHRSIHAQLVEKLAKEGAHVIIFDVYFIEPRSLAEDSQFAAALKKASNVVLAEPLRAREISSAGINSSQGEHRVVRSIKPIAALAEAAIATAPFVLPRLPVKVNHYWTFQADAGDAPTFPVVAFQLYALEAYDELRHLLEKVSPSEVRTLPRDLATAIKEKGIVRLIKDVRGMFYSDSSIYQRTLTELKRMNLARGADANKHRLVRSLIEMYGGATRRYLNFYGPPRTISTVPFHRVLQVHDGSPGEAEIDLNGKVVFVGLSETLVSEREDSFYTVFAQANGVFLSGVEIAATAFANLLADESVKPIGSQRYVLTILVWGILIGLICRMTGTLVAAFFIFVLSGLFLCAAEYRFQSDGTWYPVIVPLFVQSPGAFFGSVLLTLLETKRERRNIRKALGYYVPSDVVDVVARNTVDLKRGGQTLYGVCLFTDVAGYTGVSEKLGPRELSELMHRYFEAVFGPVKQYGGLVTNLKGDSILAVWKAARSDAALSRQACDAALGIAKAVSNFNESFDSRLPTRIGIHAGQIFLGNMGAGDHYEYGPTGDTVNTASRLDILNKFLGTEILVSEDAMHELDGFVTRKAGNFRLRGKAQPIVVYELVCRVEEAGEDQQKACAVFVEALHAFHRQSWDEAEEKFHQCAEMRQEDGLSQFYIGRCKQYRKTPPEVWDGVIPVDEK